MGLNSDQLDDFLSDGKPAKQDPPAGQQDPPAGTQQAQGQQDPPAGGQQGPDDQVSDIIFDADPPAGKQDPPAGAKTDLFDEAKWLTENWGVADKAEIKNKLSRFSQLETELAAEKASAKTPYKNKAAEVFDDLLSRTSGDLKANSEFIKSSLDLLLTDETQMKPADLIRFSLKTQYPNLSEKALDALVSKKYSQSDLASEEDKEAGLAQMEIDAAGARTHLNELKAKVLSGSKKEELVDRVSAEKVQQAWKPAVEKVLSSFKEIPIDLGKVGGKGAKLMFQVKPEVAQKYSDLLSDAMSGSGELPTPESIRNAEATLQALFLRDNFDYIIQHVVTQMQSKQIAKEISEYHNTGALGSGQSVQQKAKTSDDTIYEALGGK